jgi:hypothetical protein
MQAINLFHHLLLSNNSMKVIYILWLLIFASCNKNTVVSSTGETTTTPTVNTNIVRVATSQQLQAALNAAKGGDEIIIADGVYSGKFVIPTTANGTAQSPIILRGSRNAILDAGSISTGYVLYLQANYWQLRGFTITNGLKGLMTDGASHNIIDSIKVTQVGEEAIHLRKNSKHNTIQNTEITYTGLKTPDYGEGIYIGSAKSNWTTYTNGDPDFSDSNKVLNNHIGPYITAECIDVKEGTTGGLIKGNYFDATGITGANSADSWIDVKGNYYVIDENSGFNPGGNIFTDGYQVNVAVSGWGSYNEFKNNKCTVNASGYGFNIRLSSSNGTAVGNKVYSNNIVTGAAKGISNIPLSN